MYICIFNCVHARPLRQLSAGLVWLYHFTIPAGLVINAITDADVIYSLSLPSAFIVFPSTNLLLFVFVVKSRCSYITVDWYLSLGEHMDRGGCWQGPPLTPVLGDGEQVLHLTTSSLIHVCKAVLHLATAGLVPFQGTSKESLRQGVLPDHMVKPDQYTPLRWFKLLIDKYRWQIYCTSIKKLTKGCAFRKVVCDSWFWLKKNQQQHNNENKKREGLIGIGTCHIPDITAGAKAHVSERCWALQGIEVSTAGQSCVKADRKPRI